MVELGRVLTAMVTPFDDQGGVDYPQARRLAQALVKSGSDGVVVAGTTGESPTLSREEKLRLFAEVREAVGDDGVVVAGTGNYSTAESVDFTREAQQVGVDGALLVVPYYNKPTQEGLYAHFAAIAEATGLPCILYNVPGRTGSNLAAETVIRLSQVENIVGLKEASGDLEQAARIIAGAEEGFRVYSGNDSDTLPLLAVGGYGVVSVAAHLVGRQIRGMIESYLAGQVEEAAGLHRRLLPLFSALFVVSNPIPVKYALNHVGFRVGRPRLPLTPPDVKAKETVETVLLRMQVDLPVPAPR